MIRVATQFSRWRGGRAPARLNIGFLDSKTRSCMMKHDYQRNTKLSISVLDSCSRQQQPCSFEVLQCDDCQVGSDIFRDPAARLAQQAAVSHVNEFKEAEQALHITGSSIMITTTQTLKKKSCENAMTGNTKDEPYQNLCEQILTRL